MKRTLLATIALCLSMTAANALDLDEMNNTCSYESDWFEAGIYAIADGTILDLVVRADNEYVDDEQFGPYVRHGLLRAIELFPVQYLDESTDSIHQGCMIYISQYGGRK